MNWDAISAISEVIGAAAVVASLVFVGVQLRSNTKALKLSFTNEAMKSFKESLHQLSQNADLAGILFRGVPDPDSIEGVDQYRFTLQIQAVMMDYSTFYLHFRSGAIDQETFEALDSQMRNFCNSPGVSAYWRRSGGNYPKKFRDYVNNIVLGNFDPDWSLAGSSAGGTTNSRTEPDA